MKIKVSILVAAGAGGIVPNIVRMAIALQGGNVVLPSLTHALTYTAGLVMMSAAGAFMAWVFDETEKKKAFYLGMGLPALLQLTFTNLDAAKAANPAPTISGPVSQAWPALVSMAFAAPAHSETGKARHLKMTVKDRRGGEEVIFYSKDGKDKKSVELKSDTSTLAVPEFAESCAVGYQSAVSDPAPIPAAPVTAMTATVKENTWNGFWNALGASRGSPFKILVEPTPP